MAFPASHKTVFVLDHSPYFSMQCDTVEFDSIKFSQPQQHPQIPPVSKSMWSSATESVLEYCRVVWDIFPPDSDEQKLIRFVISDAKQSAKVLNTWDVAEQSTNVVSAGLSNVGRPEPESRRKMTESKGYNICKGVETALKILCETTATQNRVSKSSLLLNRGRIVVVTHLTNGQHLSQIVRTFVTDFSEINHVATSSDVVSAIANVELHVLHCHPAHMESDLDPEAWKSEVSLPANIDVKVFAVKSGMALSKKMMSLALAHYDLASTTVTGIPMKEEQNANSSANYDVELFHKASAAHSGYDAWQTPKDEYLTITLKWCTPRGTASDLHHCAKVSRVTPIDVNSRHSSCLTNFLLNGRSVMLEMPSKRSGSKLLSHMLTSHGGEIFIHTLNIAKSVLEDPPNIFDGKIVVELYFRPICGLPGRPRLSNLL